MTVFEELVTEAQAGRVMLVVAVGAPLIGTVVGVVMRGRRGAVRGALVGLLGPLLWVLWHAHRWLVDHLGVDRVVTVVAVFVLFALVGVGVGLLWRRGMRT